MSFLGSQFRAALHWHLNHSTDDKNKKATPVDLFPLNTSWACGKWVLGCLGWRLQRSQLCLSLESCLSLRCSSADSVVLISHTWALTWHLPTCQVSLGFRETPFLVPWNSLAIRSCFHSLEAETIFKLLLRFTKNLNTTCLLVTNLKKGQVEVIIWPLQQAMRAWLSGVIVIFFLPREALGTWRGVSCLCYTASKRKTGWNLNLSLTSGLSSQYYAILGTHVGCGQQFTFLLISNYRIITILWIWLIGDLVKI